MVGTEWPDAFLGELTGALHSQVVHSRASPQLLFGVGAPVDVVEQMVLPIRVDVHMFLLRAFVFPGALPLLICRPTLTSLGTSVNFAAHVLTLPEGPVGLSISAA